MLSCIRGWLLVLSCWRDICTLVGVCLLLSLLAFEGGKLACARAFSSVVLESALGVVVSLSCFLGFLSRGGVVGVATFLLPFSSDNFWVNKA